MFGVATAPISKTHGVVQEAMYKKGETGLYWGKKAKKYYVLY